ncbi:unnamed protein product, partial [Ixodes hexagonus]
MSPNAGSTALEAPEKPERAEMCQDKARVALVLMGVGLVIALMAILALSIVVVYREKPHPSGSERDGVDIVNYLENSLRESGFDEVKKVPYLLVHPLTDPEHPNSVRLTDEDGTVLLEAKMTEDKIPGIDTDIGPAYLAFSARGTVEAELIFVNYGRYEDFDELEKEGVSVAGFICLMRYNKGFRGDKVRVCEERGGVGAILFGDPMDLAPKGEDFVFPNSEYVGGSAMQRGTLDVLQDSETPGYPSIPEAMRIMDPPGLPKIPAQVIGYDDARVLLELLGGTEWHVEGGFNFTYRTGPFAPSHKGKKVRLSVNNIKKRLVVHDVIGVIRGSVEPGQFSVTGNHHDAWGFGASDPSSGTAALLEASRTLGAMVARGWRPRRSIVVAFWAQEEVGMAGSREWVEEHINLLTRSAVGYVNIDTCADGSLFVPQASPSLRNLFYKANEVMFVSKPNTPFHFTNCFSHIDLPGSGSDNAVFNVFAGIPSVEVYFGPDPELDGVPTGPYYHTAYETLELYESFIDPDYSIMERCSQLVGALTLSLAEAELLPYNMVDLGQALRDGFGDLQTHMEDFEAHNVSAGAN